MTSSVSSEWHEHPILRWTKDGANFSLSTDDPTCFDNSITSELALVYEKIGLNEKQIWQCVSIIAYISNSILATQCSSVVLFGGK